MGDTDVLCVGIAVGEVMAKPVDRVPTFVMIGSDERRWRLAS